MKNTKLQLARLLLQNNAIKLNPAKPFIWSSGWKSPIYCDNRLALSFPDTRNLIRELFIKKIKNKYLDTEAIAGVATGAIAYGAIVADVLELPFGYVRSTPKKHGLENLVEGSLSRNQKVVVIEDLISTGGSSLAAVNALRNIHCNVLGLLAIFTYDFNASKTAFEENKCEFDTLLDYNTLVECALEIKYINPEEEKILKQWRENPSEWGKYNKV